MSLALCSDARFRVEPPMLFFLLLGLLLQLSLHARAFDLHWSPRMPIGWTNVHTSSRYKVGRSARSLVASAEPKPRLLPRHPDLVQGQLQNGLTYLILPNRQQDGRFEAHLEILSGSANELEDQQGMAHLLEHVLYMGSPKRQLISGTGSKTNAYTDFHHTVFFAACPVQTTGQFWKRPMLPMALDALKDVMQPQMTIDRLEKERAAVLSEASMVNKMDYRVECQILSTLHAENCIAKRFPIGKEHLIRSWTLQDLEKYHQTHYRPDNAVLYIVGDLDVDHARDAMEHKLGDIPRPLTPLATQGVMGTTRTLRSVNRHFPPVLHRWSGPTQAEAAATSLSPPASHGEPSLPSLPSLPPAPSPDIRQHLLAVTRVFHHELLQSCTFHLLAKHPAVAITTYDSLRTAALQRLVLSALQIRLNVLLRSEPLFTFADFHHMAWPREGCAVTSLDISTDAQTWKAAVRRVLGEVRRLGVHGLTADELRRYKTALLTDSAQQAAQQPGHEAVVQQLMEAEANGHQLQSPQQASQALHEVLAEVTEEDVRRVAADLCAHVVHVPRHVPNAIVLSCPQVVTEEEVVDVVRAALDEDVAPLEDVAVPTTLLSDEVMAVRQAQTQARWMDGLVPSPAPLSSQSGASTVLQGRLQNGLAVNLYHHTQEAHKVHLRMRVAGGRLAEDPVGAVWVGSKTLQEGGAFGDVSREAVEMFCVDHQVQVEVTAKDDAVWIDFKTTSATGLGEQVTGLEAALQIAHILLTDFKYESSAFERAQQVCIEQYHSQSKGLETACHEAVLHSLWKDEPRILMPTPAQVMALSLEDCRGQLTRLLVPHNVEVTISGDVPLSTQRDLARKYLGSVASSPPSDARAASTSWNLTPRGSHALPLSVHLPDSDRRAVGYLAGPTPNLLGVFSDGQRVEDMLAVQLGRRERRWEHPLYGTLLLQVLQEVANRRLFSYVREERRLTYDAAFQLHGSDGSRGGYFTVSVTCNPETVHAAIQACLEALASLAQSYGVGEEAVQAARQSLLQRMRNEATTNAFYVDQLTGSQTLPSKPGAGAWKDYEQVLASITSQEVQALSRGLGMHTNVTTCVGVASPQPLHEQVDTR